MWIYWLELLSAVFLCLYNSKDFGFCAFSDFLKVFCGKKFCAVVDFIDRLYSTNMKEIVTMNNYSYEAFTYANFYMHIYIHTYKYE